MDNGQSCSWINRVVANISVFLSCRFHAISLIVSVGIVGELERLLKGRPPLIWNHLPPGACLGYHLQLHLSFALDLYLFLFIIAVKAEHDHLIVEQKIISKIFNAFGIKCF
jgi:hypothetical protein